jgi:hypothetical protein
MLKYAMHELHIWNFKYTLDRMTTENWKENNFAKIATIVLNLTNLQEEKIYWRISLTVIAKKEVFLLAIFTFGGSEN